MMRPSWHPRAIAVVSCIVAAMSPLQIPAARAQDASVAATVHVAPPTGEKEADRASILEALGHDGHIIARSLLFRLDGTSYLIHTTRSVGNPELRAIAERLLAAQQ